MPWPTDWPPDAKAGTKFLAELVRRHGDKVVVTVTAEDLRQAYEDPDPTADVVLGAPKKASKPKAAKRKAKR